MYNNPQFNSRETVPLIEETEVKISPDCPFNSRRWCVYLCDHKCLHGGEEELLLAAVLGDGEGAKEALPQGAVPVVHFDCF